MSTLCISYTFITAARYLFLLFCAMFINRYRLGYRPQVIIASWVSHRIKVELQIRKLAPIYPNPAPAGQTNRQVGRTDSHSDRHLVSFFRRKHEAGLSFSSTAVWLV